MAVDRDREVPTDWLQAVAVEVGVVAQHAGGADLERRALIGGVGVARRVGPQLLSSAETLSEPRLASARSSSESLSKSPTATEEDRRRLADLWR